VNDTVMTNLMLMKERSNPFPLFPTRYHCYYHCNYHCLYRCNYPCYYHCV